MKYKCEPKLRVGVMTASAVDVTYLTGGGGDFVLHDVTIGKGFHWERKENQTFKGELEILRNHDGTLTAVNVVPLEEYLLSVISSEMCSTADVEFLKAHAVISRSWLLAQIDRKNRCDGKPAPHALGAVNTAGEIVKWYDHEDHTDFDVCADDHCQRYQGVTRISSPHVKEAVTSTSGLVLTYDGKICDARFSKCCGGVTEEFSNCWEPHDHEYLRAFRDDAEPLQGLPDLTLEENAARWINGNPSSFCNTRDAKLLEKVLNNYDREENDFFRWEVRYSPCQLDELVARRSGIDFGSIQEIKPVKRGPSGRIYLLKIRGSKREITVGKELEIRRWLSESHLRSSAFVVERDNEGNWIFRGAGWGHGVGLCQIGAAVMAAEGYTFDSILEHYFPGSKIEKFY